MTTLFSIILSCFTISLCVWVALFLLFLKHETLNKITLFLVSLSAGALIGGAFLHLLPEAAHEIDVELMFLIVLLSFIFFFFLEKLLFWRHCHKGVCEIHTFGYMNLVGDSIHNFIDGVVIASTFLIDIKLGFITTFIIALHEIPQEIGDFGVLIHAGFKKKKALIINFLVALTVVLGGVAGYYASLPLGEAVPYLLPFAAGGFIYIASSDLMPEIRKETNLKKSLLSFLVFIFGVVLMYTATLFEH